MERVYFKRKSGIALSSQMTRALSKNGIKVNHTSAGLVANLGKGIVGLDCRRISDDVYEVVPKEQNKRFRVKFVSMWGGGCQIHSFDTFAEADFFREQVHGEILAW